MSVELVRPYDSFQPAPLDWELRFGYPVDFGTVARLIFLNAVTRQFDGAGSLTPDAPKRERSEE